MEINYLLCTYNFHLEIKKMFTLDHNQDKQGQKLIIRTSKLKCCNELRS